MHQKFQTRKKAMFSKFLSAETAKNFAALSTLAGAAYLWMVIGTAFVG